MTIDLELARSLLIEAAATADQKRASKRWVANIRRLSDACEAAGVRTHIAFIGTALLAKATDADLDVYSVKNTAAEGSYSARTLAHGVLVKESAHLGIHLGVTGREPLNNQPYFRMERLDDGTRIHSSAKEAFAIVLELADQLSKLNSNEAKAALRAFVLVRREYQPSYSTPEGDYLISPATLAAIVSTFVSEQSDGGRRAQGVVAGLLDAVASEDRVLAGRINDPSRHYPGDIAVSNEAGTDIERAIEVRDKPVSPSDIHIFCRRCLDMGVQDAAVIAVASNQPSLDTSSLQEWANEAGLGLRLFEEWEDFVSEVAFWSPHSSIDVSSRAAVRIHQRLIEIEAPEDTVRTWNELIQPYRVDHN